MPQAVHSSNFNYLYKQSATLSISSSFPGKHGVSDQLGNPTGTIDLADAILRIAPSLSVDPGAGEIYHYCGAGATSWHGFACFIFEESAKRGGPAPKVEAIATADFPTPARRPANSRLDTSAFTRRFGFAPPSWEGAAIKTLIDLLPNFRRQSMAKRIMDNYLKLN